MDTAYTATRLVCVVGFAVLVYLLLRLWDQLHVYFQRRRDVTHIRRRLVFPRNLDYAVASQLVAGIGTALHKPEMGVTKVYGRPVVALDTVVVGREVRYYISAEAARWDQVEAWVYRLLPEASLEPDDPMPEWDRVQHFDLDKTDKANPADVAHVLNALQGAQDHQAMMIRFVIHPWHHNEDGYTDYAAFGVIATKSCAPNTIELIRLALVTAQARYGPANHGHKVKDLLSLNPHHFAYADGQARTFPHAKSNQLPIWLGWPINGVKVSDLVIDSASSLGSSDIPSTGFPVAKGRHQGKERILALRPEDLEAHTHISGKTGVGKSTLLTNLAVAQMESGAGVGIIDPHGDLIEDILERIPKGREKDVVLVEPHNIHRAVPFNIFAGTDNPEVVADQLMAIFTGIYSDTGIYANNYLRAAIQALASVPGMTLVDVPAFLTDDRFRTQVVSQIPDAIIRDMWERFNKESKGERGKKVSPALHRVQPLLMRNSVRLALGQSENKLDMRQVILEKMILLLSLPKGLLGEDTSKLIGALYFARLWHAAQGIPRPYRVPFYLLMDEFQNFMNMPLGTDEVLAEARKYRLGLILAHQYEAQMPPSIRVGLHTNTRTNIKFQVNADDANVAAKEMGHDMTPGDFTSLGKYQILMQTTVDGATSAPARGTTFPPSPPTSDPEAIRSLSRRKWSRSATEIDQEILTRQSASGGSRQRPDSEWGAE